jgi:hypothetical protein
MILTTECIHNMIEGLMIQNGTFPLQPINFRNWMAYALVHRRPDLGLQIIKSCVSHILRPIPYGSTMLVLTLVIPQKTVICNIGTF